MAHFGRKYESLSKWFEWVILAIGVLLAVASFLFRMIPTGGGLLGLLLVYVWTFMLGTQNGMRLLAMERRCYKTDTGETVLRADIGLMVRLTLLASLPLYLSYILPFLLLPIGGFYAFIFFVPIFAASGVKFASFSRRWRMLEIKPNFYWVMQIGICVFMIVLAYIGYFLGFYGGH